MSRAPEPSYVLPLIAISLVFLQSTAQAAIEKPLISRITKDYNTSLYTISIITTTTNGAPAAAPLVVDLAGSLVWSTCRTANQQQQQPRRCRYVDGGLFWSGREPGSHCSCIAHPVNPVNGECSTGDLTRFSMSANTTNGTDVLYPETFAAVGACAPERLVPANAVAVGVAGFSHRPLSLPSQIAGGGKFSLCLPVFATFGNTPVYLPNDNPNGPFDYTRMTGQTPFLTNTRRNDGYYLPVKRISVSWSGPDAVPVSLPAGALELDARTGRGGVMHAQHHDVVRRHAPRRVPDRYSAVARVAGEKPFQLCYGGKGSFPLMKRFGYDAPAITLELAGGATGNWTIRNGNVAPALGSWRWVRRGCRWTASRRW
uniref:Xylanase inhibitor N-terminal domain-containing protein n=1 Tax=Leersia perrieri TaxID=77586 RepID=A0A0D9VA18_9ORYZ